LEKVWKKWASLHLSHTLTPYVNQRYC
jgi:hypothetical protein